MYHCCVFALARLFLYILVVVVVVACLCLVYLQQGCFETVYFYASEKKLQTNFDVICWSGLAWQKMEAVRCQQRFRLSSGFYNYTGFFCH